jgi:UDP-N-acetylmuramyl pentapeptide phosphotransferase/UDP-N-acetylglucosamine-1-phosphate transferase
VNPLVVRVLRVLFGALIITSLVLGDWVLALLHTHTLVLVLLVDDSVKIRRRLRDLETTVNELIES